MIRLFRLPARFDRRVYGIVLFILVLIVLIPVAIAQVRRPSPAFQDANRALLEGRYDQVPTLTARLDQQDPAVVALNARALIARGRYQEAESMLRPAAQRANTSDAALELGLLLQMLTRPEAVPLLERIADSVGNQTGAANLDRAAQALKAVGKPYDANDVYREALGADPTNPAYNTGWGDLFLERYKPGEAVTSYQDALKADPKYTPALVGMARALADDDPPKANEFARKALEINPSSVDSLLFLAGQAVDAGQRDEARKLIQQAFDVNPSSLDAHALIAGLAYVQDKKDEYQDHVNKALAIAPKFGEVYRVAGDMAARNYRFDEAAALARKAIELEPGDARALSDLGVHLLRTGDEPGALTVLEQSFKIDAFNPVTKNLLVMMDSLQEFVTVEDRGIILKMSKEEAPILQPYVLRLAHQALDSYEKRYNFRPKAPILIEVFPKHDDFAVRNVGLPGMTGALGACFGRVVTMDSPKARPPGEFQWEATLWHELGHVITLQMSEQRIPRWLTEGISEYEETIARPYWGRGMDVMFAQLMNENQTIKLKDLNGAFTDPRKISLAYFEATLLVQHIVATFGDTGLQKLVTVYKTGVDTDAALKETLSTSLEQLQSGFDQFLERKYGALRRALQLPEDKPDLEHMTLEALQPYAAQHQGSFPVMLTLAEAQRKAGQLDQAIQSFEKAAGLVPQIRGPESPQMQIAEIALEKNDKRRAMTAFRAVLDTDFDNIVVARRLAKLYAEEGVKDPAQLRYVYDRISAIDPYDSEAHRMLGRLASDRNDAPTAILEFRTVIALGPVDRAAALTDLAESYFKGGQRSDARQQTIAALEIAPSYERAQDLLLRLSEGR